MPSRTPEHPLLERMLCDHDWTEKHSNEFKKWVECSNCGKSETIIR